MKYDIMFTKNCYFCGDEYTKGVLYIEKGKKPYKIRICKKHLGEMKLNTPNGNCRVCNKNIKKHSISKLFSCYLKLPEHQPTTRSKGNEK